jgi:site-specific recombinase
MSTSLTSDTHTAQRLGRTQTLEALAGYLESSARATNRSARLDTLVAFVVWLRTSDEDVELTAAETDGVAVEPRYRRFRLFVAFLERSPEARDRFAQSLATTAAETDALTLFAEVGLANDRGLWTETTDRIARRLLPRPRDEHDLSQLLMRLHDDESGERWLAELPVDLLGRLYAALGSRLDTWTPWRVSIEEALSLLAARIESLGLSEELRVRRAESSVRSSAYYRLPRSTEAWLKRLGEPVDGSSADEGPRVWAERTWRADVLDCRHGVEVVLDRLETTGVSVDVVYALDVIQKLLDRMEILFAVLAAEPGAERFAPARLLWLELVRGRREDRSLRSLARENLRLMARKVIERTGATGEHYIAATRTEWFALLGSAAGGGAVTTVTAVLKVLVLAAKLPLFVEMVFAGTNYAISFVAIQVFGFTLATKQPAMTASTLAGIFRRTKGDDRSEQLATHITRIVRSQLAAAFGNIVLVGLGAALFDIAWLAMSGNAFMEPDHVDHVLRSLDPLHSGTVFYAALTGVLLWMSSLVAGWVGNWTVYRRIPQALEEHRFGAHIGERRMHAVARWFSSNVSGFGGSIALGFLLGMTPVLGEFTGLPLDVRHVTLSTGQLVLAAATLGSSALQDPRVPAAVFGIAVIFVLNLSVSFVLALGVAARARNVTLHDLRGILRALGRRFVHSPLSFFLPVSSEEPA